MSKKTKLIFSLVSLALCASMLSSCLWYDVHLCWDVGREYCDWRFSCTPVYAAGMWPGGKNECYDVMSAFCESADMDQTCDFNDAELRQCRDEIGNRACLTGVPPVCYDIYTCY